MIIYKSQKPLKKQIIDDIKELEVYKCIYNKKIFEYKQGTNYISSLLKDNQCNQMINKISYDSEDKIRIFSTQVSKIKRNLDKLNEMLENIDKMGKNDILVFIKRYNRKYEEIKRNISLNNFDISKEQQIKTKENVTEETISKIEEPKTIAKENTGVNVDACLDTTTDMYINTMTDKETYAEENNNNIGIKNNDTLLISEVLNVVIFPYTSKEIIDIIEDPSNNYKTEEDVIAAKFTKPLSNYKFQIWSRYNETIKLLTEREDFGLADAISLAIEMMGKRYLHPAIISACRSLDELDVYLDCLEKNELDDFKIFKIKYELHPLLIKDNKIFDKIKLFILKHKKSINI